MSRHTDPHPDNHLYCGECGIHLALCPCHKVINFGHPMGAVCQCPEGVQSVASSRAAAKYAAERRKKLLNDALYYNNNGALCNPRKRSNR